MSSVGAEEGPRGGESTREVSYPSYISILSVRRDQLPIITSQRTVFSSPLGARSQSSKQLTCLSSLLISTPLILPISCSSSSAALPLTVVPPLNVVPLRAGGGATDARDKRRFCVEPLASVSLLIGEIGVGS